MEHPGTGRSWRSVVLTPDGDGTLRRRGSDVFRLITAAVVIVACWVVLVAGARFESALVGFLTSPPDGVRWLVTIVWVFGSLGMIVVIAAPALVAHRRVMARDVALARTGGSEPSGGRSPAGRSRARRRAGKPLEPAVTTPRYGGVVMTPVPTPLGRGGADGRCARNRGGAGDGGGGQRGH
jgi:hypothetical protein